MSIHADAWGRTDAGAEIDFLPCRCYPETALLVNCLGTGNLVWEGSGQPAQESGPETCHLQETSGLEFSYEPCRV